MGTENKKNTKWIIIGSIVFVLAILVAVGPILVTKYMRTKWQDSVKYKTSNILMKVSGILQKTDDNIFYLKGDNDSYYVLDNVKEEILDKIGQHCSVLGKMRLPKGEETIVGNKIRLFLGVQKITFDDSTEISNIDDNDDARNNDEDIKKKTLAKTQLRLEVNTRLNKPVLFDVIKGKVSTQSRKTLDGKDVVVTILTDEFGDNYMLYKKGFDLSPLKDMELICLGRELLPLQNMPIIVDEITFEIYEVFDYEYRRVL